MSGPSSSSSPSIAASTAQSPVQLATSSNGRVSGKPWKAQKSATRRSHLSPSVKTKRWEDRMQKKAKDASIKKLEAELKEEKAAEIRRRREITQERKRAAEERQRLEEDKAKMGAKKAARLRKKAGRTKKINH
ncbi:hypothetical protein SCHPADRAFT_937434 [Schizopora paradoxa]|uniref:rRNA-processing protein n=1 Tax=Schizopora paradoxa TaxID=27342 RepID=A0A0H2S615_9AGAM|nr:hypothetical protein SCHPADRAFT_937434 [Schizopora paradoxa]